MKKLILGGVAAAAMLAVSPVVAQVAPVAAPTPVAKAHTRADAVAHVQQMFARLDTNRDGFLVKAEADAARAAVQGQRAQRRAERAQRVAQRAPRDGSQAFDRLDVNKDGSISRAEFDATRQQRMARRDRNGDGRPDARAPGMRRMMAMRGMGAMHGRMFEMADANRDGRVSLQEATAAAYQRFNRVDANRDGTITREERQQFRQQMRATRQRG